MSVRLTASLSAVRNDTGRIAYCGPTVLSSPRAAQWPSRAVPDEHPVQFFRGLSGFPVTLRV